MLIIQNKKKTHQDATELKEQLSKLLIWAHHLFEIYPSQDTQPKLNEGTKRKFCWFQELGLGCKPESMQA